MGEVVVTAEVDVAGGNVTLAPHVFSVEGRDTLVWRVTGSLGELRPTVRFVGFPGAEHRSLLEEGNVVEANGGEVRGKVSVLAFRGHYRYQVELAGGASPKVLRCFWQESPGTTAKAVDMGGGEKSDGPVG